MPAATWLLLRVRDSHGNCVDLPAGLRGMEYDTFSRAVQVPFQGCMLSVVGRIATGYGRDAASIVDRLLGVRQ